MNKRIMLLIPLVVVMGVALALLAATIDETPNSTNDVAVETADVIEHSEAEVASFALERDPDVPDLPFDDNPDPSQCGIPQQWGNVDNIAYLTGFWEGDLIQPTVFLYDSHSRLRITAEAPHGTQVEIILFQSNPVLDYYYIETPDGGKGWVPKPFLSFEPPAEA